MGGGLGTGLEVRVKALATPSPKCAPHPLTMPLPHRFALRWSGAQAGFYFDTVCRQNIAPLQPAGSCALWWAPLEQCFE